jgi:hypothetical protein
LGEEGEEILEDTDIAGICYSQMNYFSKTPENSWNHYIIKPITGIDGLKGYVEDSPWTPNSTHDNLINHSCLKYSIEFQQNFKNVISINNKGLVNQESGEYVFHFHDNFVSSQVVGDDLYDNYKTWNTMDEYFEDTTFHNLEPSFYENNDESDSKTGIIMNYLSYNTDFNPINWPTNNPLKIKIK